MIAMEDTYSKALFVYWDFKCKFRSYIFYQGFYFSIKCFCWKPKCKIPSLPWELPCVWCTTKVL